VIGLPIWWKTTEVYRVQLPYSEISALGALQVTYVVHFDVLASSSFGKLPGLELLLSFDGNADKVESRLHPHYFGRLLTTTADAEKLLQTASSLEQLESSLAQLHGAASVDQQKWNDGNYAIYLLPSDHRLLRDVTPIVVGKTHISFVAFTPNVSELARRIQFLLRDVYINEEAVYKIYKSAEGHLDMKADKASMRALRSTPGYDITFTLLNPQPDLLRATWDVATAVNKYMQSLLDSFGEFANITVKSQYLYSAGLGVQVQKTDVGSQLTHEQLPHIINPVEAFLASHVSTNPHINFIVYIPTRDQSPLTILDANGKASSSNAFLSPRWGGLLVYNVDTINQSLPVDVQVDLLPVMSVFLAQLRLLLGIHPTAAMSSGSDLQLSVVGPDSKVIADWEMEQWLREKCVENIITSSSTLISLAELLDKISNIVINDDIGAQVFSSVKAIERSSQLLADSDLKQAYLISKLARDASEKAFFDPSLLELLYFPEDQKFAIYVPLFLPVGFPIVLSLLQAVQWLRGARGKQNNKQKTE
jgi:phosphatidylinositol glycan class S